MEHPHPNLVWNNEALRQQVLETELEVAKLRLEREKGNCPQCIRFRGKLDREKMAEVFRCCDGIYVYSPEALADKMIRYLTE